VTSVLLIYPYFKPRWDRSVFRFPPLGLAYIAASLRSAGYPVQILDCTFLGRKEAIRRAKEAKADVAGFYCMAAMLEDCRRMAGELRPAVKLLVAGGPHPSWDPSAFLDVFDVVVRGEGERTIVELMQAFDRGASFDAVAGIAHRRDSIPPESVWTSTPVRKPARYPDSFPFPARDLLPNADYIRHGRRHYGYSVTTVLSTRGCPFHCEFCSNAVFDGTYRERPVENVLDEVEETLALGYQRISFADDVFTLRRERVGEFCDAVRRRAVQFDWECLGRVDSIDAKTARMMRQAGCRRIYFGIESGSEKILRLMNKRITPFQARSAVEAARRAGLETGAFFILFYPGDTDATVLETLRFARSLPLDYAGFSIPYPLPGTALYERVKDRVGQFWKPSAVPFFHHRLTYRSDFSEAKIRFGGLMGGLDHALKRAGGTAARWPRKMLGVFTDRILVRMK
jgi:anaerobic magnesium-protoporphyrin IX monomethyl ester cyclase